MSSRSSLKYSPRFSARAQRAQTPRVVAVRADPDEDDFEARLAKLNKSKAGIPTGASRKEMKQSSVATEPITRKKKAVTYDEEVLWREFSPSQNDLIFNLLLTPTLIWIPFAISAIGRCAFVNYRITDKRIIVKTEAPWKKEESNVGFHEISGVVGVNRAFGAWGDMVVTLDGGEKLEMRSIPEWTEVRDYIKQRRDDIRGTDISQEELLTGRDPKKGFA